MANPEHLAILKQGVEQWSNWRMELRRKREIMASSRTSRGRASGARS
jgi:hypothetical protein